MEPKVFGSVPTQEAYDAACAALWKHRARVEALEGEMRQLIDAGKSYMHYHTTKFYADIPAPTGLWPAIEHAEATLAQIPEPHVHAEGGTYSALCLECRS